MQILSSTLEDELGGEPARHEEPGGVDLVEVLTLGLVRFRWWILGCAVVGTLGGVSFSLSQPNQYTSTGKVLLRLGAREQLTPESAIEEDFNVRGSSTGITDEIELLGNPEVHRRVVDLVGAEEILHPYDPTLADGPSTPAWRRAMHAVQAWWFRQGSPIAGDDFDPRSEGARDAAAQVAAANMSLYNVPRSNVLVVNYATHSPELAGRIVDAYLQVFNEWHREVYASEEQLSFLTDQLELARTEAAEASRAYSALLEEGGFYDLPAQKTMLVNEHLKLAVQIEEDRARLDEIREQLRVIDQQVGEAPETIERVVPPMTIQNPRYGNLLSQYHELNDRLSDLAATYDTESDSYRKQATLLEGQIADVEELLRSTPPTTEIGGSRLERVPNPLIEDLVARRAELQQEGQGLRTALRVRQDNYERREQKLVALLHSAPKHDRLQMELRQRTDRANQIATAHARAQTLQLIDRDEKMSNLVVIQAATTPLTKEGPQRSRSAVMGLLAGLFLGLVSAAGRHVLDARLRYPEEVERRLGLRLLGVLPEQGTWSKAGEGLRNQRAIGA